MCGIIGYVGAREAVPILIKGLEHLEYRGYDSAGIACLAHGRSDFFLVKEKGKLSELKARINGYYSQMNLGIGHTRWATHGEPSRINAHPHLGQGGRVALVHNGIVENYAELKSELKRKGHRFKSETDTEVAAHLIEQYGRGNLAEAMRRAVCRMEGFFSFAFISRDEPNRLFAFKRSNPLVVGIGDGEHFVASDVSALLPYTKKVIYLDDDEVVELKCDSVRISHLRKRVPVRKTVSDVRWSVEEAQKGGFPHFMLKEIHEQPRVLGEILQKRVSEGGRIEFDTFDSSIKLRLKRTSKIFAVSCGTAHHAGLVADYLVEDLAQIPTEAHVSSEFRYSAQLIGKNDAAIFITQSGETADTLAALRLARGKGALTLAVVNVVGSTIAREADAVIYTHAGPEVGVASTKAYLAQLMTLALLSMYLGVLKRTISPSLLQNLIHEAKKIPGHVERILNQTHTLDEPVKALFKKRNFLYLGRGYNFPNALEGALKLKEITYAHAHGYAAGEMKHGPIALIDEEQPVVCLVPQSKTHAKMISNIEEIRARKGMIISIATEGDEAIRKLSRWVLWIPKTPELFSPILTAVPLQLFAYQIAVLNHRDVDQPRNLAKSVTVE
jgi:glucosamine--fructose-6-phosphate aminotransferase (isomerizing)